MEIKFRCWDKRAKKMRLVGMYGGKPFPFYAKGESTNCPFCAPDWDDLELDLSDPMQFTGLKDKNGEEIYEGDIYRLYYRFDMPPYERLNVVEWTSGECCNFSCTGFDLDRESAKMIEVVGNIHENPELLKK